MAKPKARTKAELRATAFHEAGHAVANIALGLPFTRVSIVPGEGYNGSCEQPNVTGYHGSSWADYRSIARRQIVSSYAGMAAQRLVDPQAPDDHGGDAAAAAIILSEKYRILPRHCGYIGGERHLAYLDRFRAKARRLVRRNRRAIEALAEALLQRGKLDGEEAERIVEPLLAQPKTS